MRKCLFVFDSEKQKWYLEINDVSQGYYDTIQKCFKQIEWVDSGK